MNNYEILGLQKGADISEVKRKFRALSKKYHPDITGGDAFKFISIRKAYEALLEGDSGEPEYNQDDFFRDMQEQMRRAQQSQHQSAREQWEAQMNSSRYHYQNRYGTRSVGEYRFLGIDSQEGFYRIKFFVKNVSRICVYGKNGTRIGFFDTSNDWGNVALKISFESAEWGEYIFEVVLEDRMGGREVRTYKVKKPMNSWEKIIDKLKFWKK